ncbi:MAG: hypothetical protein K8H88_06180 [Sandaracinaceae bacterium]|nr:hypothetical protein [Sandaracinaceae bacterium]
MQRESKSGVRSSATRAVIDALVSSGDVLEALRAERDRAASSEALGLRRALRILEAAEGVRTDDACLVLEIDKPYAEEEANAPEIVLRKLVRRTGT